MLNHRLSKIGVTDSVLLVWSRLKEIQANDFNIWSELGRLGAGLTSFWLSVVAAACLPFWAWFPI